MKNPLSRHKSNRPEQSKFHVKKSDIVRVIAGAHNGKSGKVLRVLRSQNRVIVEGVNIVKKAVRRRQENDKKSGFEEREGSIHISNVKLAKNQ
jgi:large subunit ribosomal protein L24